MKDFIEIIKNNSETIPNGIAVIDGDRKISYKDFYDQVNSISHQLIKTNLNPKVVIDLEQSVEAYALIVAVLNVGGTYCPLSSDPRTPFEKKNQIINEFKPDLIVVKEKHAGLKYESADICTMDDLINEKYCTYNKTKYEDEAIIYVIYTSGTTGFPKGVKICRKALNKFLEWSIPTYAANENDIWAQFSPLSFDLSVVDIFTCLCSGASLFVIKGDGAKSLPANIIEEAKITIWHSSPVVINSIIKREKSKVSDLTSLRLMSFCGAPLTKDYVEFLFEKNPSLTIFNTYGPTEGTLFCTCQSVKLSNYLSYCTYTISIGTPIPGWNIRLEKLKDTTDKELIVYGEYIGKGYTRDVPDNGFQDLIINGKTVSSYLTGDIVYDFKGNLFFESRKDRQVKINGNRLELSGIEYHLKKYLNVDCVVICKDNKLYCFLETDEEVKKNDIMDYLATKLEQYEIPKIYIPIYEIPKTVNSKINYEQLKQKIE